MELTKCTGLRASTVNICLLESKGNTVPQELKDHTALLGLTGSKDLHTLTGHPGLLKFLDWIDLIFLGFDNDPILIVPILRGCNRV